MTAQRGYRPNNIEFLDDLMSYSKHGALIQAFVLEGLRVYAEQVAHAPPWKEETLISQAAWKGCALEVLGKLIAREQS